MIEERLAYRKDAFLKGINIVELRRRRYEDSYATQQRHRFRQADERRTRLDRLPKELTEDFPNLTSGELVKRLPVLEEFLCKEPISREYKTALCTFRKVSCAEGHSAMPISSRMILKLVELAREQDLEVVLEALWSLTNLASGPPELCKSLIQCGAVEAAVLTADHPDNEIAIQAVWLLGNLSGDFSETKLVVMKTGILSCLAELLDRDVPELTVNIAWLLGNLFIKVESTPFPEEYVDLALKLLPRLMAQTNPVILETSCRALSTLLEIKVPVGYIDSSLLANIMKCMRSKVIAIKNHAIKTIGSISQTSEDSIQVFLEAQLLDLFHEILNSGNRWIINTVLWALSNLLACNQSIVMQVISHPIFSEVLAIGKRCEPYLFSEIVWCVGNAILNVNSELVLSIAYQGGLEVVIISLQAQNSSLVINALSTLEKILECGKHSASKDSDVIRRFDEAGGLHILQGLMSHNHPKIFSETKRLLNEYFDNNEEDTIDLSQAVTCFNFS